MEGISLAAVMARYEDIFSPLMIAMVNAGERGGFLSRALMDTARYVEQDIELRNLIRRETMYPKIVLAFACVLVPAVNLIISLVAPGSPFGLSSPLTTPKNWIVYGPVLAFVFLFWRVGLNIPSIRSVWDTIWTPFPGIGRTMREFAMARFGRAFGAMYRGGLPHPESLVLAADTCGNEYLRSKIYSAEQPLRNGQSITEAMKATNVFDWAVIDMVATGERTGNIDFMLLKMAEYYEQEAAIRARKLGMWLGILVFVIVAIYVFYIVLNFYLSYFSTVMGGAN